jgi:selenide, water dikinase
MDDESAATARIRLTDFARAAGCAAKLGPADLSSVLATLPQPTHPDVLVGTATSDDAGVFRLTPDLALVQTVDFFTPIVDDPFRFGAVAAANALSDVYAMGGEPRTALNIACFPQRGVPMTVLGEILRGGIAKAGEAGVVVLGGHTVIDEEIKFGMAVTGLVHPGRFWRNVGARPGDALVLTKALGTGIVTTAHKHGKASAPDGEAAITSMLALNAAASRTLREFAVHACTDVTGFSLLGHGFEMAHGSGVRIEIEAARLPSLPGARALAAAGQLTGGCRRNREWLADRVQLAPDVPADLVEIAFDPQTSGGLLAAIPAATADAAVAALHAAGVEAATIVGAVRERRDGPWIVLH